MATGTSIIIITALIFVLAGILIYVISWFNRLISLKNNIRKSWSNIDVLLKQRNDEIPNVVATVKGYAKHEKSIMDKVAKSREMLIAAENLSDKAKASSLISQHLKSIFALSENYPNLKANENFLQLQKRIGELEDEIADRREFYNDTVTIYNTQIQVIPYVVAAKILGYLPEQLFAASEEEKKLVSVE